MSSSKHPVIGIIGGMGPEATMALFREIINATPITRDQDHLHLVIDSNPKIPDRTSAITGKGDSPIPALIDTARNLERAGATLLAMPCVTAHYFADHIKRAVSVKFVNMLDAVHECLQRDHVSALTVGILATTATINAKLFDQYLGSGYKLLYPPPTHQADVMEAIYGDKGIKRGNTGKGPRDLLLSAGNDLIDRGAQVLVAGCTEIPLVLQSKHVRVPLINPLKVLAQTLVRQALGKEAFI
ncbi:MAG: amino acid racemase [Kiritimatiellia bacterium]|nr:amino acid racemase [Kiritimatiellia bacterium]